jgi:23S rRNA (adenine2030-N6)-methyltransferase
MGRDRRVKIEQRDGFEALPAFLPPPERRGLVLVDPPFEAGTATRKADFDWMLKAARAGVKRWPQGVYIFWRPIKHHEQVTAFDGELATMLIESGTIAPEKILVADLWVRALGEGKLAGAGVVIANAPFGVAEHLRAALPWLCEVMKQGEGAGWRVESPSAQ